MDNHSYLRHNNPLIFWNERGKIAATLSNNRTLTTSQFKFKERFARVERERKMREKLVDLGGRRS